MSFNKICLLFVFSLTLFFPVSRNFTSAIWFLIATVYFVGQDIVDAIKKVTK